MEEVKRRWEEKRKDEKFEVRRRGSVMSLFPMNETSDAFYKPRSYLELVRVDFYSVQQKDS